MERPQIPVLLSRRALIEPARPAAGAEPPAPLEPIGTTFSMAQQARWVDRDTFAIGRWDGTLTLFGPPTRPSAGPRIESAAVSPAWAGLEMITPLDERTFATSNDAASLALWDLATAQLTAPIATLPYDSTAGVANSGAVVRSPQGEMLVTGHANGWLLVWRLDPSRRDAELLRMVDVRSPDPVPSPYRLWNVRAVHPWRHGLVLTGGEDGDLCLVDPVAGEIRTRVRFNPRAQRGINDIALLGDIALVGSCSVGRGDSNTWAFRLGAPHEIAPLAHADLVVDETRNQVFNFSVELARAGSCTFFFCATEEGLLWSGCLGDDALRPRDRRPVSSGLGAAITYQPASRTLAVIGDNVHLFRVRPTVECRHRVGA